MAPSYFETDKQEDSLVLQGDWVIANSGDIDTALKQAPAGVSLIDARAVGQMDLWGALKVEALAHRHKAQLALNNEQERLRNFLPMERIGMPEVPVSSSIVRLLETLGRTASNAGKTIYGLLAFIGEIYPERPGPDPAGFFRSRHLDDSAIIDHALRLVNPDASRG